MSQNWKEFNKQKHLFRSIYCGDCNQRKSCGKLNQSFCCPCQFQMEQERAEEYSNYQQVYQRKVAESKEKFQQLQLLKNYQGCSKCGSKEIDAYHLYNENKLICQPCRMKKEGSASGSISFLEQQKWYKRYWKIDLGEWLDNYNCLPVNAECARKWQENKEHLPNKCDCLEIEAQKHYSLVNDNLKRSWEKLKECQCETSSKIRVSYIGGEGSGWIYCEKCEKRIESAGHHGVIKNRNDPKFWGLNIKEKVLCADCLGKFIEKMPPNKKYTFNKYQKRGFG